MKPSELVTGLPGHPTHPPLTDPTIGLYTGAAVFAVLSALGVAEENLAVAWWLGLVAGLAATVPLLTVGGWLGGTVVFVHGMRVMKDDRPRFQAVDLAATNDGSGGAPRQGLTRESERREG